MLRSLVTFINGLTAGAVANAGDWPAERQIEQLRLQLELLHAWAMGTAGAPPLVARLRAHSASAALPDGY